jgi:hypothetical protein
VHCCSCTDTAADTTDKATDAADTATDAADAAADAADAAADAAADTTDNATVSRCTNVCRVQACRNWCGGANGAMGCRKCQGERRRRLLQGRSGRTEVLAPVFYLCVPPGGRELRL